MLTGDDIVMPLVRLMLRTCTEREFAVLAYVFMPDHLHLLLHGCTDDADFTGMMTLLRQRTAIAFSRLAGERLWQDGYFERVLRKDEDTLSVANYILQNPVRAGLAEASGAYAYGWAAPMGVLTRTVTVRSADNT